MDSTLDCLLRCITALNKASEEEATTPGIVCGRVVAQVLTQINQNFHDDDEILKIASIEGDDELTQEECEINWRILMPKLFECFQGEYDTNLCYDVWRVNTSDIVKMKDTDTLIRLLIVVLSAAIISENRSRKIAQDFFSDRSECSEEKSTEITEMMQNFLQLIKTPSSNDKECLSDEIVQYKIAWKEISQSRDRLKKENDELLMELNELRKNSERYRDLNVELEIAKNKIVDAELKIKFLESSNSDWSSQLTAAQTHAQEVEFRQAELEREIFAMKNAVDNLTADNRFLTDECETTRSNEQKLKQKMKELEGVVKNLERDSNLLRQREKDLAMAKERIEDYVKQLTEFDSLKTKIASYEQLLRNEKMEREKLNNELILAIRRANEAEGDIMRMQQSCREESSRLEEQNCFSTTNYSLSDDLNDTSNEANNNLISDVTNWKTKCEMLASQNRWLESELRTKEALNESIRRDLTMEIEKERCLAERKEWERKGYENKVASLEQSLAFQKQLNATLQAERQENEDQNTQIKSYLEKACSLIRIYSTGSESSAENLRLRAENEKLQRELDNLRSKIDQLKYESCQEHRLIATNWHLDKEKQVRSQLLSKTKKITDCHQPTGSAENGIQHPLAAPSNSSMSPLPHHQSTFSSPRSFVTRQLEASKWMSTR